MNLDVYARTPVARRRAAAGEREGAAGSVSSLPVEAKLDGVLHHGNGVGGAGRHVGQVGSQFLINT